MIAHMPDIHPAFHYAQAAAVAAVRIHLDAGQRKTVEEAIDGAQRADKPAEQPVAEHAGQADDDHDHPFVGKDRSQLIEGSRVGRVLQQADSAFKGTGGADVLAESRQNEAFAHAPDERDGDDEHRQEDILQV